MKLIVQSADYGHALWYTVSDGEGQNKLRLMQTFDFHDQHTEEGRASIAEWLISARRAIRRYRARLAEASNVTTTENP